MRLHARIEVLEVQSKADWVPPKAEWIVVLRTEQVERSGVHVRRPVVLFSFLSPLLPSLPIHSSFRIVLERLNRPSFGVWTIAKQMGEKRIMNTNHNHVDHVSARG